MGHIVPEADREVKREPLSVARHSSIPGIDMKEMEALQPVMLLSSAGDLNDIQEANELAKKFAGHSFSKRSSVVNLPRGVAPNNPFGQSPFADIEVGHGEVQLSKQSKTLSRVNLLNSMTYSKPGLALASGNISIVGKDINVNSE